MPTCTVSDSTSGATMSYRGRHWNGPLGAATLLGDVPCRAASPHNRQLHACTAQRTLQSNLSTALKPCKRYEILLQTDRGYLKTQRSNPGRGSRQDHVPRRASVTLCGTVSAPKLTCHDVFSTDGMPNTHMPLLFTAFVL